MTFRYVLTKEHTTGGSSLGWDETVAVEEVAGTEAELTPRLRPWALARMARDRATDGRYYAYLVEPDEKGRFDTYLALAVEDIIWFYDQEYVPAP